MELLIALGTRGLSTYMARSRVLTTYASLNAAVMAAGHAGAQAHHTRALQSSWLAHSSNIAYRGDGNGWAIYGAGGSVLNKVR